MAPADRPTYHRLDAGARQALLARMGSAVATVAAVRLAYVFGSFVRDAPFQDIDVAVLLDEPWSWRLPGRVEGAIVEQLDDPRYPLDVVPLNAAPPSFRVQVTESGRLIYERQPREAIELWVRARSELMDLRAWRRAHRMAISW